MTLLEIIENIKNVASQTPNINYVGSGDIYVLNSAPNIDYSVFFITQGSHQWGEDTITYNLNLYFVDRLLVDKSNADEIQSTGIIQLQNIINKVNGYFEEIDIDYGSIQFTPFFERFADDCSGVFCTVQITVPSNIGLCYE